jgi:hypothetical protein
MKFPPAIAEAADQPDGVLRIPDGATKLPTTPDSKSTEKQVFPLRRERLELPTLGSEV